FNHPAPLRSASLHLQQRNEIMRHLFRFVKNIFRFRLKLLSWRYAPLVSTAALVCNEEANHRPTSAM
ncbi:MAG: hypothetical protein ACN6QU_20455, partial [Paraburkholderia terricola]